MQPFGTKTILLSQAVAEIYLLMHVNVNACWAGIKYIIFRYISGTAWPRNLIFMSKCFIWIPACDRVGNLRFRAIEHVLTPSNKSFFRYENAILTRF